MLALLSAAVTTGAVLSAVPVAAAVPAKPSVASAGSPAAAPPTAAPLTSTQTAVATARRTQRPVEVTDQTTERSQVFADPDGRLHLVATREPTRVRKHGAWTAIDTTLRVGPDGTVAPAATLQDVAFSSGGRGPLVTVRDGARRIALSWPGALPAPTLTGDTATYAGVLPGVDLKMIASDTSYREVLVVHDAAAARNPALRTLHLGVTTQGVTLAGQPNGSLVATDPSGAEVFHGSPPVMWDSSRGGNARASGGAVKRIGVGLHGRELDLTPPAAALVGPGVTYPVYVDPAMAPPRAHYLTVQSGGWNYYDDTSEVMRVGDCDWPECTSSNGIARSYFNFNSTPLTGQQTTAHVYTASVSVTQVYGASCATQPVALWNATTFTSATKWPGPAQGSMQTLSSAGGACGNASAALLFSGSAVVAFMQSVAAHDVTVSNFLLRAPDESERLQWKKFGNKATLNVTYDFAPDTPTVLSIDASVACPGQPLYVRDRTPVFHAKSFTNGGAPNVGLWWEVAPYGGARVRWNTSIVSAPTSGVLQTWATNSSNSINTAPMGDGNYGWRVQAESWMYGDSRDLRSGWTGVNAFTIDGTPPATPTVAGFDYPVNYWGAPSNAPGQFTFYGGTDTDTFTYAYDRSGGEPLPTDTGCAYHGGSTAGGFVVASAGTATITVPSGMSAGYHTLYVKAFDHAHNLSAESSVRVFYISPTVLDEGRTQYEGEDFRVAQPAGQGDPTYNNGNGYPVFDWPTPATLVSDGYVGQLAASAPNARFSFPFTTLDAYYALGVQLSRTTHSGKVQLYLDDSPTPISVNGQTEFNLYSQAGSPVSTYVQLGGAHLAAGQHKLTVVVTDKDPASVDYIYTGTYGDVTLSSYHDHGYSAGVDLITAVPIKNFTSSSLAAAFNNNGIATDGVDGAPDIGPSTSGLGLSEQAMTAQGFGPGQSPTVDGVQFTMPQVAHSAADNVLTYGQTVMLPAGTDGQYPPAETVELLVASTCKATPLLSPATQLTMNFQNPDSPGQYLTNDQMLPSVGLWTDPATGPVAAQDNIGGVSAAATFDYVDANGVKDTTHQATIYHVRFLVPALRAGLPLESVTLPDLGSTFTKTCDRANLHVLALTTTG
jgi:hypothetical protein